MANRRIDENRKSLEEYGTRVKSLKKMAATGIILILTVGALTLFLEGLIPEAYLRYVKIVEVGIIGYFFIQVVSEAIYRITRDYFQTNANAIKSL